MFLVHIQQEGLALPMAFFRVSKVISSASWDCRQTRANANWDAR